MPDGILTFLETREMKPRLAILTVIALTALLIIVAFILATAAGAQGPTSDEVKRISDKLNCPLCQGRNLTDCPLPICEQMRQIIAQKLAAGESDEQIMQFFVAQYGEQVLNQPPLSGFNIVGWVVPFVGLAGGAAIVFYALRQWRSRRRLAVASGAVPRTVELPTEYLSRLEQELKEYK